MKKTNIIMRVTMLIICFGLTISCKYHHPMEKLSIDIISSDTNNIDSIFNTNKENLIFFQEEELLGRNPSEYFDRHMKSYFGQNYNVLFRNSKFRKNYYTKLENNDSETVITLINISNNSMSVNFHYKFENDVWMLKYIQFNNDIDGNVVN